LGGLAEHHREADDHRAAHQAEQAAKEPVHA